MLVFSQVCQTVKHVTVILGMFVLSRCQTGKKKTNEKTSINGWVYSKGNLVFFHGIIMFVFVQT